MVKDIMSRLGLGFSCVALKVVLKGPIYRRFFVGKLSFLGLFNQKCQIPFIMGWLCMLLGFGFQENNSIAPQ